MIETLLTFIMALGIGLSFIIPSPTQMREVYTQGKSFLVMEDYKQAERNFRWIVETESRFLNKDSILIEFGEGGEINIVEAALYQLGNLYKKTGDYELALEEFRKVVDEGVTPELKQLALYQIILVNYQQERYEAAILAATELLEFTDDPVYQEKAFYNQAWSYYKLKRYEEAIRSFMTLADRFPDGKYTVKSLFLVGQIYYDSEDYRRAAATFQRLIDDYSPKQFSERDWSSVELKKLRRLQQKSTVQSLDTGEEERVELIAKAYLKAGECYEKIGDYDQAYNIYQQVTYRFVPFKRMVENAFLRMAEIEYQRNGITAGIQIYQKALEESEDPLFKAKMQYLKARLYQEKNYFPEAIKEYQIYIKGFSSVAARIEFPVADAYFQIAESYFRAGDYQNAIRYYQVVLDSFPDARIVPNSYFNLALAEEANGQLHQAIVTLDSLRTKFPHHYLFPTAVFQQARFYSRIENYQAAITNYQFLMDNDSLWPDFNLDLVYIDLGLLYKDLHRYPSALAVLNRVENGSPYYPGARSSISEIYLMEDKPDSAVLVLTDAISSLQDSSLLAEFRYYLGRVYLKLKKYDSALQELNYVLQHTDNLEIYYSALYASAHIKYEMQEYPAAISLFKELISGEVNPELRQRSREKLALAYVKIAQSDSALALIDQWLTQSTLPEEQGKILLILMQVNNLTGNYQGTRKAFQRLQQIPVSDQVRAQGYFYLGNSYFLSRDYSGAGKIFQEAYEQFPRTVYASQFLYQLGMCYYLLKDYEEALRRFQEFIEIFPEDGNRLYAFYYSAFSYMNLGEWSRARTWFQKIIKHYPDSDIIPEVYFQIGESYYNERDYRNARKYYTLVAERFQDSPFVEQSLYNIAWSLIQMDSTREAMSYFQHLADSYPGSDFAPYALFTIGDFYYNQKDYKAAKEAYSKVIQRYPEHELATKAKDTIHEINQIASYLEYQKAMKYFDEKQYEEAIQALEEVLRKYPEADVRIGALVNIAAAYEQLGRFEKALQTYDQVITRFRDLADAREAVRFAQEHINYIRENY